MMPTNQTLQTVAVSDIDKIDSQYNHMNTASQKKHVVHERTVY